MIQYTAYNLVRDIEALPKDRYYNYIAKSNSGLIHIEEVNLPAGPIYIKRWNPKKGETITDAKKESISKEMIWRIANAVRDGEPINMDRLLGGSYNTRSVLEALLAYTTCFYYCYPGRIMDVDGKTSIEHGHKHLIYFSNKPHEIGKLTKFDVPNMAVSEIPFQSVTYDNLILPDGYTIGEELDIEVIRRHTQIQIALYLIGLQMGFRTWIAQNDKGIIYKDKPLAEQPGIIQTLNHEGLISAFPGAEPSARFIDCIWFQNHRYMPAVMEVEHTTGVTSGLTRMKGLQDKMPSLSTRYVIVAPDDNKSKVIDEANRSQFLSLDTRFFSYSAVEELYYICSRRKIQGVSQEFLDCYMERVKII